MAPPTDEVEPPPSRLRYLYAHYSMAERAASMAPRTEISRQPSVDHACSVTPSAAEDGHGADVTYRFAAQSCTSITATNHTVPNVHEASTSLG
jgi:hypothetical protein